VLLYAGVKHNIPILRDIITQPTFVSGDITTNFMPEVYPSGFTGRTALHLIHKLHWVSGFMLDGSKDFFPFHCCCYSVIDGDGL